LNKWIVLPLALASDFIDLLISIARN